MSFVGDALEDVGDFAQGAWDDLRGKTAERALEDAARRQEEISERQAEPLHRYLDLLEPQIAAGQAQLPTLEGLATAEGYGGAIGEILQSQTLAPLIQERQRAADQALASRGLRRSGAAIQAAADIPTDLAMQIEGELNRRRQSISGLGQTGIQQSGNIAGQIGSILAGGQQAALQSQLGAAQAGIAGTGNLINLGANILGAFSDERLKKDLIVKGRLKDLDVFSWVWNDDAKARYGLEGESYGFVAQDVKEKYPHHVRMTDDGVLMIDYESLLAELKHD